MADETSTSPAKENVATPEAEAGPAGSFRVLEWSIACLAAAVPLVVLVFKVSNHGLAFPYWDQWLFSLLLDESFRGELEPAWFWAQHNEHRLLFPRLLMFVLARLTRWNVGYELASSVVMATGTFTVCVCLARRTVASCGKTLSPWCVPVFSALVFSWAQMENWVWGWQLQIFMNTLAVTGGVALLAGNSGSWRRLVFAILLGVVATCSFANGLLCWFAVLPLVVIETNGGTHKRAGRLTVWMIAFLVVAALYFHGYNSPTVNPSFGSALRAPSRYAGYVVLYLGGPVTGLMTQPSWHGNPSPFNTACFMPGIAGLVGYGALSYMAVKERDRLLRASMPWLCLGAYAVGSALVTGATRAGFGLEHALTSRYMTIAALFWVGLTGLVFVWTGAREWSTQEIRRGRIAAAAIAIMLSVPGTYLFVRHNQWWENICRWKQMGWEAILAGHETELYLQDICWDPEELQNTYLPIVKKHRLCGFETAKPDPERATAYVNEALRFINARRLDLARTYLETAMILDPEHEQAKRLFKRVERAMGKHVPQ